MWPKGLPSKIINIIQQKKIDCSTMQASLDILNVLEYVNYSKNISYLLNMLNFQFKPKINLCMQFGLLL